MWLYSLYSELWWAEYSDWFKLWFCPVWPGSRAGGVTGALCVSVCVGVLRGRLVHGYEYTTLPEDWLSIVRAGVLVVTPPGSRPATVLFAWMVDEQSEKMQAARRRARDIRTSVTPTEGEAARAVLGIKLTWLSLTSYPHHSTTHEHYKTFYDLV